MSLDSRLRGFHPEDERVEIEASLQAVRAKARRRKVFRRAGIFAATAAVVAAAVTVPIAISDRPAPHPVNPGPQPSPMLSFHPATPTDRARSIAYVDEKDLWIYDVRSDRTTRLTNNGEQRIEGNTAFYGDRYVLYISNSFSTNATAIEAIPLEGGPPITIVQEQGTIFDFSVSPDGSSIVYLHTDYEGENTHLLKRVGVDGGAPVVLRELGVPPGRGAGSDDEVSVSWSPDGATILVTDTHIDWDPTQTIRWLDATGRNLKSWSGTHARWSPDGKTIYYRYADEGDSRWRALNIAANTRKTLGFREGSNNLAISPDGTHVAYDTSWHGDVNANSITPRGAPVVYIYDLQTRTETVLKNGSVFPLWISPNALLATDARGAETSDRTLNSWEPTGTVTRLGLDGANERVSITSTAWDDAGILFDV